MLTKCHFRGLLTKKQLQHLRNGPVIAQVDAQGMANISVPSEPPAAVGEAGQGAAHS